MNNYDVNIYIWPIWFHFPFQFISVQFSRSVCVSLRPYGLQHARPHQLPEFTLEQGKVVYWMFWTVHLLSFTIKVIFVIIFAKKAKFSTCSFLFSFYEVLQSGHIHRKLLISPSVDFLLWEDKENIAQWCHKIVRLVFKRDFFFYIMYVDIAKYLWKSFNLKHDINSIDYAITILYVKNSYMQIITEKNDQKEICEILAVVKILDMKLLVIFTHFLIYSCISKTYIMECK